MFSKKKNSDHNAAASPETPDPSVTPVMDTLANETDAAAPAEPSDVAPQAADQPAAETDVAAPTPENAELLALKDRYTRLMADFDNYRKRQLREREDLIKRANEALLGDLLPVIDHLELALAQASDPASPFVVGVKLVYDQFLALLDRHGMVPLDAKGEPFDPTYHEALSQMSSATVPANIVMDQFRRGWLLHGRLLRPAQVIVSSGAPDAESTPAEPLNVTD
ncbi:MAG TPA: nucleotide exchange factor GrpE [Kiritimatiellia bacterium]|nr:nucleotide exchange factor GrpE [Kiritimatiellia bacterium]HRU71836.1 nucleotide exchange factor GrpE [Kiritimatiellia bacterium]